MNSGKSICLITVLLLLTIAAVPTSRAELPRDEKGSPEHYDFNGSPENFEDLFFPRLYGEETYNFTLPKYLQHTHVGGVHSWAEKASPSGKPIEEIEDEDYANMTLKDDEGEVLMRAFGYGGGGRNTTLIGDTSWVKMRTETEGTFSFFLAESKEWDDLFEQTQSVRFTGSARSYNLFGLNFGWIEGFDNAEQFIRIHLRSDFPLRFYLFENSGLLLYTDEGFLVDYEEDPTQETTLDLRYDDKKTAVGDMPFFGFLNPGNPNEEVKVEFELEVHDYPPDWGLPVLVLGVFIAVAGGVIWVIQKKAS